ncbi:MAG: hypothetical protein OEY49_06900 [Candidatus Heimdallarchaeota archaeon]|nr:hypothetical protein [Candidatus Heimdallarchaeota archaeon]
MYIHYNETKDGFEFYINKRKTEYITKILLATCTILPFFGGFTIFAYSIGLEIIGHVLFGITLLFYFLFIKSFFDVKKVIISTDKKSLNVNNETIKIDKEHRLFIKREWKIVKSSSNDSYLSQIWSIGLKKKKKEKVIFADNGDYKSIYNDYIEQLSEFLNLPVLDLTCEDEVLMLQNELNTPLIDKLKESKLTPLDKNEIILPSFRKEVRNLYISNFVGGIKISRENNSLYTQDEAPSLNRIIIFSCISLPLLLIAILMLMAGISTNFAGAYVISFGFFTFTGLFIFAIVRGINRMVNNDVIIVFSDEIVVIREQKLRDDIKAIIPLNELERIEIIKYKIYDYAMEIISDKNRVIIYEKLYERESELIKTYIERLILTLYEKS